MIETEFQLPEGCDVKRVERKNDIETELAAVADRVSRKETE